MVANSGGGRVSTEYKWEQTLSVSPDLLRNLEDFISHPSTRQQDIFAEQNFPVDSHHHLHWLIKHDLFEGVVLHLTLLDTEAYQFLAGYELALAKPEDALGDFEVSWQGDKYRLHVVPVKPS